MATYKITCTRCSGTGFYIKGVCFLCNGRRYIFTTRNPETVKPVHVEGWDEYEKRFADEMAEIENKKWKGKEK